MRYLNKLIAAAGLAMVMATSAYAETVTPQDASQYVGSSVTVEGVVSQVSRSGGTTFINFGGRYPNHVFYAVILRSNSGFFSDMQSLEGRQVAISGQIEFYKGKPQIVLRSPDQIELR
jgi:DNA/RNA endonuclease YhcR with UshA esterase domain